MRNLNGFPSLRRIILPLRQCLTSILVIHLGSRFGCFCIGSITIPLAHAGIAMYSCIGTQIRGVHLYSERKGGIAHAKSKQMTLQFLRL